MTQVHVDLNRPAPDAPGWGPTTGPLVCSPYSRHVVGTEVIVPDALIVELTDGEVTVELVGGWVWRVEERVRGGAVRYIQVPESSTVVEYSELVDIDPVTLEPTPAAEAAWDLEAAARVAGDAARIRGAAVSTDGSFSLPTPTGAGMEFVMVDGALDDIRYNGTSL